MTRAGPGRDDALRLLRERFFNRTDLVAILAPWGKPCPVEANGSLDELLLGHLLGKGAPESKVKYANRRGSGAMKGRFRIGSYCPAPDDTTRWLCLDFDGAGHADALADPQAAALAALDTATAAGLPAYLERSGGGKGWHLWCFFDPPLAAAQAQALGRALAPKDALLAGSAGEVADPRSARGIEVFPKQPKIRRNGFGNLRVAALVARRGRGWERVLSPRPGWCARTLRPGRVCNRRIRCHRACACSASRAGARTPATNAHTIRAASDRTERDRLGRVAAACARDAAD